MSDLKTLLDPLPPAQFLGQYWGRRSFVTHARPDRFPALFEAPELQSLPELLVRPCAALRLWFEDASGQYSKTDVGPDQALRLHGRDQDGIATVVVDGFRLPVVDRLIKRLARDLGAPVPRQLCNVYVSRAGRRTQMHFDHQEVFIVQIRGSRRWRIAPNQQVVSPTQPYIAGQLPAELRRCADTFPDRMPARCQTVTLKPGSVLFMPRGTWHEGRTLEDSIALTLTFPTLNWIDVMTGYLRARLVPRPEWRAVAAGLNGPGPRRAQASAQLARLVAGLGHELQAAPPAEFQGVRQVLRQVPEIF
jgi:50S ribosomal protein L16 3-hydroxylase